MTEGDQDRRGRQRPGEAPAEVASQRWLPQDLPGDPGEVLQTGAHDHHGQSLAEGCLRWP